MYTWTQLGFHGKPCAFLDIAGFYQPLYVFLNRLVEQRFLKKEHLDLLMIETEMDVLLDRLAVYQHSTINKWLDKT